MNSLRDIPKPGSKILFVTSISALLIALQAFSTDGGLHLRYENSLVIKNEWWRLISGHFIHLGWAHLFLNIAGILLLVFLFHQVIKPLYVFVSALLIALCISLMLLTLNPELKAYVGLSGVLHGFLVMGALASIKSSPGSSIALLIIITIKLIWEQFFADANAMHSLIGGSVIYDAHLYGAISGLVIYTAFSIFAHLIRSGEREKI